MQNVCKTCAPGVQVIVFFGRYIIHTSDQEENTSIPLNLYGVSGCAEAKSKLADQEDDDDFFDDSHLRQHRGSAKIEVDVIRRIFVSIPIPNGYGDWDGGISMHFTHIPNVSTYTVHLHIY